jgi:hypothetical protein
MTGAFLRPGFFSAGKNRGAADKNRGQASRHLSLATLPLIAAILFMTGPDIAAHRPLTTNERLVLDLLQACLQQSRSLTTVRLANRLAEEAGPLLCRAGLDLLCADQLDPAAERFLALLMMSVPSFWQELIWLVRSYPQVSRIVLPKLQRFEPRLDIRLARHLPPRYGTGGPETLRGGLAETTLGVLDEISEGRRLVPVILHLAHHTDQRLSSKATLVVGRRIRSVRWVAERLEKSQNPRIAASCIESLWGVAEEAAQDLFQQRVEDPNNRVAGNALIGLHLSGEASAAPKILQFAERSNPEFRSTAAWAIGMLGNPEFAPDLTALAQDEHPAVRAAAIRALLRLRRGLGDLDLLGARLREESIGPVETAVHEMPFAEPSIQSKHPEAQAPRIELPTPLRDTVRSATGRH